MRQTNLFEFLGDAFEAIEQELAKEQEKVKEQAPEESPTIPERIDNYIKRALAGPISTEQAQVMYTLTEIKSRYCD